MRAWIAKPDSNDVIDEILVEWYVGDPIWKGVLFVYGKIDCCPGWCRGYVHSCSGDSSPVGVAELDEVVSEENLGGWDEGICVIVVEGAACFSF